MITNEYNISMTPTVKSAIVRISQYDTGARILRFYLYANNEQMTIPTGTTAVINGLKSDGYIFTYPMTVSTNYVEIEVQDQMSACKGNVLTEIMLSNSEGNIGSANFILYVEVSPIESGTISASDLATIEEGIAAAQRSMTYSFDAEAWAVGQRNGVDVDSDDETYHNNSKYYKEQVDSALSDVQGDITALQGRMTTAEGDIDDLETDVATNTSDLTDLKSDVNEVTEEGKNLVYSQTWNEASATIAFVGDNVIITSTPATATYTTASTDIDVTGINSLTVSYASKSSTSTGSGAASIRYGFVNGTTNSWKGYITSSPMTIDVSTTDKVRIGLYVNTASVVQGTTATFNKLQVEYGDHATAYTNYALTAIDRSARAEIGDIQALFGTGTTGYSGERISLSVNDTIFSCDIAVWKDFNSTDIPNLASYELYKNQSMTIYGGYVFLFNAGGGGIVLDYNTKSILSQFVVEPTANQHQNGAQFTDIYYQDSDEFPLIMISRCGNANYSGQGTWIYDEAQFYHVTRSNNTFTFSLVNTVSFSKQTYGATWGIDNFNKRLYITSPINNSWRVETDNPKCYWAFDMPSDANILSGNAITLAETDAVAVMTVSFAIGQGLFAYNNLVYEAVQDYVTGAKQNALWVVNPYANRILSRVPIVQNFEPEGCAMYNGKIYLSQRRGDDTSSENPCRIYEISF